MICVVVIASICLVFTFIMRKAAKILRNKGFYNFAHLIDGMCVNDDDDDDDIIKEKITMFEKICEIFVIFILFGSIFSFISNL